MAKIIHSLETKLIASFLLLILVIVGSTFFYTYSETKNALKVGMQEELMTAASAVATTIDGDSFSSINSVTSDEFRSIHLQLQKIRSENPAIQYIYTMKYSDGDVFFVVDADFGTEDGANLGEKYDEATRELIDGFTSLSAESDFTTDEWGTVLSGYAPIKDSEGNSVGLVGVDMDSKDVIARQDFIGSTIYYIMGISILVAGLIIGLFSLTIIKDIKKLNISAEEISKGNTNVTIDVNREDEIGELADSFSRMVASLKFMMTEKTDRKSTKNEPAISRKKGMKQVSHERTQ